MVAGTAYACCLKMFLSGVFLKKSEVKGNLFKNSELCQKIIFPEIHVLNFISKQK